MTRSPRLSRGRVGLINRLSIVVSILGSLLAQTETSESGSVTVSRPGTVGVGHDAPLHRVVGDHVLFTCVVRHDDDVDDVDDDLVDDDDLVAGASSGNYTVLWKRRVVGSSEDELLTAGDATVIDDQRFRVIHDQGGSVYVLEVANVKMTDSGSYVCETSSASTTRTFYSLSVSEKKSNTNSTQNFFPLWNASTQVDVDHDFTDCCVNVGVKHQCLGYCSLNRILQGQTVVKAAHCESEFGLIVGCMADGKDHTDCCRREGVPSKCRDICEGKYNVVDANDARTQVACNAFTANTLFCVAEGIKVLPGRPSEPWVSHLTSTSFEMRWSPSSDADQITPDFYQIALKHVSQMVDSEREEDADRPSSSSQPIRLIDVPSRETRHVVSDLQPFSVYNVSVKAVNKFGSSLPSYHMLVLTLRSSGDKEWNASEEHMRTKAAKEQLDESNIDAVETCCIQRNVTHKRCVQGFCDSHRVSTVSVPDMMICAPWVTDMFGCLTANLETEDSCCLNSNMPDACRDMCLGNITDTIDFNHFQCVSHMPSISRCLLRRRGLLASSPTRFRFSNVAVNIGLLHWEKPEKLGDTVTEYRVHLRQMAPRTDKEERLFTAKRKDFVLENLDADASYEVYVGAVNGHGEGDASVRIVFRTATIDLDDSETEDNMDYKKKGNASVLQCCRLAGVDVNCEPLCRYDLALSSMPALSSLCQHDSFRITKCLAGGRDHKPCCQRMGVSNRCDPICQGVQSHSALSLFRGECSGFIGNILTCMQDNFDALPPAVQHFRAQVSLDESLGNSTQIDLYWDYEQRDFEQRGVSFQVFYKRIDDEHDVTNIFRDNLVANSSTTSLRLSNLTPNATYRLFCIALNSKGTSVPSSILVLKTSLESKRLKKTINGVPMAPHGVFVRARGYDFIEIVWNGPVVSHPNEHIRFKVSYKQLEGSSPASASRLTSPTHSVLTDATSVRLTHLRANTQYLLNVRCQNSKGESEPSETLRIWTNPIVNVALEAPQISPKLVKSGGDVVITCFAIGSPLPQVGLYVSGHLVRKEKTRRLVTTITNVTKHIDEVSCHAYNGFGVAQMRTARLRVQSAPSLQILLNNRDVSEQRLLRVREDDHVDLQCLVTEGEPRPKLVMGKKMSSQEERSNASIVFESMLSENNLLGKRLSLQSAQESHEGLYFCQADNPHGQAYVEFRLQIQTSLDLNPKEDSLSCCERNGVPQGCQGICALSIDLDFLLHKPECFQHFNTLMACAADGSDHRHCCQSSGVSDSCLDWCRGESFGVSNSSMCALTHARDIAKCFDENRTKLPSPPRNVHIEKNEINDQEKEHVVTVVWDEPERNADQVQLYRVMWRPKGVREVTKADTTETWLRLKGLRPDEEYELVVKAGNDMGTSQLTQPITFVATHSPNSVLLAKTEYSAWPSILITLLSLLALVGLVLVAYVVWQRHRVVKRSNKYNQFENEHNGHVMAMDGLGKQDSRHTSEMNTELSVGHAVENPMFDSGVSSN